MTFSSLVFPREELSHPAGVLCPPQRLSSVRTGRLDPGEDGPSGTTRHVGAASGRQGPRGRGEAEGAHIESLQLNSCPVLQLKPALHL